jgi:hypothetical protein
LGPEADLLNLMFLMITFIFHNIISINESHKKNKA